MRFLITMKAFESITREEDVAVTRYSFAKQVTKLRDAGKLADGGIFADGRAGFLLVDVDSPNEMMHMLGGRILDHFRVESHPVVPFDELFELFKEEKAGG